MFSLTNKIAIVPGAGSGIGQGVALLFAKQGARVEVFDLKRETAQETADQIRAAGGSAQASDVDLRGRDGKARPPFLSRAITQKKRPVPRRTCECGRRAGRVGNYRPDRAGARFIWRAGALSGSRPPCRRWRGPWFPHGFWRLPPASRSAGCCRRTGAHTRARRPVPGR